MRGPRKDHRYELYYGNSSQPADLQTLPVPIGN